jgi:hypothetical protein
MFSWYFFKKSSPYDVENFPQLRRNQSPSYISPEKKISKFITGHAMSHSGLRSEASFINPCKLSATVLRKTGLLFTFVSCISKLNLFLHSHVLTFLTINYVKLTLKTVPIRLIGFPIWRINNPPFTRTLGSIICSSILRKWKKLARPYKHQNTDYNTLTIPRFDPQVILDDQYSVDIIPYI